MGSDFDEIRRLASDLRQAGATAEPAVGKVIKRGANNIKKDLRARALGSSIPLAMELSRTISYDMVSPTAAEIGPAEGHAGSFAFLYFGNRNNGPVLPDPGDSLANEIPNIEKYLDKALGGKL